MTDTRGGLLLQRSVGRESTPTRIVQLRQPTLHRLLSSNRSSSRVTMCVNTRRVSSLGSTWYQLARGGFCVPKAVIEGFPPPEQLYEKALEYTRHQRYAQARRTFQQCVAGSPDFCRAWVSYAQMEKKCNNRESCREVLQLGLKLNPRSACLLQAWGLHELQEGNGLKAYGLLESSVRYDARNAHVLKWKAVKEVGADWHAIRSSARQRRKERLRWTMQTAAERKDGCRDN
mmetsp:Transcript_26711/g.58155  ORF Transcript_26711/g.58155 Transcript_26711/m.58155 type:complete len:231 (-) Transcript_26711:231-923(-)